MQIPLLESISKFIYRLTWQTITPEYLLRSVPILFAGILISLVLAKREKLGLGKGIAASLLLWYLFLILAATVLCRRTAAKPSVMLEPFWSYRRLWQRKSISLYKEIFWNCLMLSPVGFLLPMILPADKRKLRYLVPVFLGVSYTIEFSQLLLRRGTFELVDDPFDNLVGALLGYAIFRFGENVYQDIRMWDGGSGGV